MCLAIVSPGWASCGTVGCALLYNVDPEGAVWTIAAPAGTFPASGLTITSGSQTQHIELDSTGSSSTPDIFLAVGTNPGWVSGTPITLDVFVPQPSKPFTTQGVLSWRKVSDFTQGRSPGKLRGVGLLPTNYTCLLYTSPSPRD